MHFLRWVDKSIERKKKAIVEQIKGIREERKKRGRKGAADVRSFTCVYFLYIVIIVKKEQGKV